MARFSIVTVSAFDNARLRKTLQSFINHNSDLEYIVVVPRNDFEGVELVSAYSQRFQFPSKLILDDGIGIYNAMNMGLQEATGDFVIYWNSGDVLIDSDGLLKLLNTNFSENELWIVFDAEFTWRQAPSLGPKSIKYFIGQSKLGYISHQQIAIRRSALISWGGFDTRYQVAADFKAILQASRFAPSLFTESRIVSVEYPNFSAIQNRVGRIETTLILIRDRRLNLIPIIRIFAREFNALSRKYLRVP